MESVDEKLNLVLQKLSFIEKECSERWLSSSNQMNDIVTSIQRLATKIEVLESHLTLGRQTYNQATIKKNDESMRPKILKESVYEQPRSRDAESPKRSHSVSFVLNPLHNKKRPNRSNSISFVVNTPKTNHFISCKTGKSNQFMTETVPENSSCSHEETPGASKVSNSLSTHPVKLRPHLPKHMGLLQSRYSADVRPATMASLDSLESLFYYYPKCRNCLDILNGQSQADSLSYMQSSCGSDCSSEVSITKAYARLINFPPISRSSSVLHRVEDARNSIRSRTDELTAFSYNEQSHPALMESTHMNPKLMHSTLVASSGVVGIAGCVAKFEKDTFKKPVQVKLICYFPKQVSTDSCTIVTPEVHCIINDDAKFLKPFTITLPTCYVTSYITIPTKLMVQHCSNDGRWQAMASVEHGKSLNIEFESSKPGRYRCVATHSECEKLSKNVISLGFLLRNEDSNLQTVVWCIMDDLPHLEAKTWLEMSPPSIYKRILPCKPFELRHNQGVYLSLRDEKSKKELSVKYLEGNDLWQSELFKKIEFPIRKPVNEISRMTFSIRNEKRDLLLEYSAKDFPDLVGTSKAARRSFIHNDLSLKRSASKESNIFSETSYESAEINLSSKSLSGSSQQVSARKGIRAKGKTLKKKIFTKSKKHV